MNIKVRKAAASDADILLEMLRDIGELHQQGRPDLFRADPVKYDRETILALMENEDSPVFVAADEDAGDRPVGYAFCQIKIVGEHPVLKRRRFLYIDDFYISESCRRQHAGTVLLGAVRAFAASQEIRQIELNVWAFNQGAVRFYESCGMTVQRCEMELPVSAD